MRAAAIEVTAEEWHQDALGIIAQYAEQRLPFAADEIHHHLPEPHDPNAWGRAFSAARRTRAHRPHRVHHKPHTAAARVASSRYGSGRGMG